MGFFDIFRRPKPKPQYGSLPAGKQQRIVAASPEDWRPGQTILDDFVVERVLGEGGMGKVYLVKSQTTGMRFAVKRAKGLSEGDRRNFLAELQTWIDLPEHPNLVPCRFFRTVGDEVLIFAEYVEGGSLKNRIDSRKLYEGAKEKALERILDTAIQFAWGLHCLHELGLVHQDVKPANVMMEKDAQVAVQGVKAKVTDFGLARARAAAGGQYISELGQSILVSSGGFTPAYCSPEQASGRKVDRSTDVWSWGVSVMEMFQGGVTWQSGGVAGETLEAFLEHNGEEEHIPAMPEGVAELLNGCFRKDPAQRWQSMEAVVQNLKGVYQGAVGAEYRRALGKIEHGAAPQAGAGERRTREGLLWMDPRDWLERALRAGGRDPVEAAEILARHASSRRGRLVADVAAYDEARRFYERLVNGGRKDLEYDLANLCNNAAFVHETADDSSGALALYDRAIEILERVVNSEGRHELANDLAGLYQNKAVAVGDLGDYRAAVALYDRAIEICERLVNVEGRRELANKLASLYMNKTAVVSDLGDNRAAVALSDRAIEILERLVNVEGRRDLANDLAMVYSNKAKAVCGLGDPRAAMGLYDQAIGIRERLVNVEGRRELANNLARLYMNKAIVVSGLRDNQTAVTLYNRAIEILERLVNVESRRELTDDLARLYMNKAVAVSDLGNNPAAMALYDRAIAILERLVNVEGRRELANDLSNLYMNKASAVMNLGDYRAAVGLSDRAIEILERLVNVEGRRELANKLGSVYIHKANVLNMLEPDRGAMGFYDRAIEILEGLVNVEGRRELANDLARLKAFRDLTLLKLEKQRRANERLATQCDGRIASAGQPN
jgi:tetratricopeptide (TPR) repeat protein